METRQHELGDPVQYRRVTVRGGKIDVEYPKTFASIALIVDESVPEHIATEWLRKMQESGAMVEWFRASESHVGSHDAQNRFRASIPYDLRLQVVGSGPIVYTLRADYRDRFNTVVTLSYRGNTQSLFIASCGKDPHEAEDDDEEEWDDEENTDPPSGARFNLL